MRNPLILMVVGVLAALGLMAACNTTETKAEAAPPPPVDTPAAVVDGKAPLADGRVAAEPAKPAPDPNWPIKPYADPHAVIEMVGGGTVVIELEKELVPKTVENFIRLGEQKFYDGTVFHRVIPDFMAQGGSPEGKGMGGPGWNIDLEIHPNLRHVRGAVAMARKPDPNSAGSQFYICYQSKKSLDDGYAVFGKVVAGQEIADAFPKGSPNPAEMSRYGLTEPEAGFPATIETLRIVDGKP